MKFRAAKLEQQGKEFWVVRDTNEVPVSEKFKNKSQALSEAVRLNNLDDTSLLNEPLVPKPQEKLEVVEVLPSRFNITALCRFKQDDGCWVVASIPVDPIAQETHGPWKIERGGNSVLEGNHLFKVLTQREVFSK